MVRRFCIHYKNYNLITISIWALAFVLCCNIFRKIVVQHLCSVQHWSSRIEIFVRSLGLGHLSVGFRSQWFIAILSVYNVFYCTVNAFIVFLHFNVTEQTVNPSASKNDIALLRKPDSMQTTLLPESISKKVRSTHIGRHLREEFFINLHYVYVRLYSQLWFCNKFSPGHFNKSSFFLRCHLRYEGWRSSMLFVFPQWIIG